MSAPERESQDVAEVHSSSRDCQPGKHFAAAGAALLGFQHVKACGLGFHGSPPGQVDDIARRAAGDSGVAVLQAAQEVAGLEEGAEDETLGHGLPPVMRHSLPLRSQI